MNEYSPGKIRILLECWIDYLAWGKLPPLRHDSRGWHLCDPDEHIRQKHHKESDGLEAIRVRADLKMAIRPRLGNEPREPLTRGERTYIITRFFAGF
ncbi:MAG: hypothetical protein Q8M94_20100, partial [Ignavibacteria bacterium]|nr:hypothetical protein [Ignavibacteria bacterium]